MAKKQFSTEMGAIRIISKGPTRLHRGPPPHYTFQKPPDSIYKPIKAYEYSKDKPKSRESEERSKTSLADVVSSGHLGKQNPVLIIVHMYKMTDPKDPNQWDKDFLNRQAEVIKAAKTKNLPIYVVGKEDTPERKKSIAEARAKLPDNLLVAVGERYEHFHYFAEKDLGNALEGKEYDGGAPLMNILEDKQVKVAIVIGQSYGQCIDSTILGMWAPTYILPLDDQQYHSLGLLDIGIDVVTARNVLYPSEGVEPGSSYFCFEMESETESQGSSDETPSPSLSSDGAALKAATDAAVKTPSEHR